MAVACLPQETRPTPRKILVSLRAFSLPVSVLPVFLATAIALPAKEWNWPVLVLSALGAGLLHLGGNLLNDYFDFRSGVDRPMHSDVNRPGRLLVKGMLRPSTILTEAVVCLAVAGAVSGVLVYMVGPALIAFALAALALLYSYTGPPLHLKYRALGELVVFLAFGPVLMAGAAWAQVGRLDWKVLVMSVPVGLATTAVLVGNNCRDRQEDSRGHIRTLAHLGGGRVARGLYVVLVTLGALLPAVGWGLIDGPIWLIATPVTLLLVAGPVRAILADRRVADVDVRTARVAAILTTTMWLAYVLAGHGQAG